MGAAIAVARRPMVTVPPSRQRGTKFQGERADGIAGLAGGDEEAAAHRGRRGRIRRDRRRRARRGSGRRACRRETGWCRRRGWRCGRWRPAAAAVCRGGSDGRTRPWRGPSARRSGRRRSAARSAMLAARLDEEPRSQPPSQGSRRVRARAAATSSISGAAAWPAAVRRGEEGRAELRIQALKMSGCGLSLAMSPSQPASSARAARERRHRALPRRQPGQQVAREDADGVHLHARRSSATLWPVAGVEQVADAPGPPVAVPVAAEEHREIRWGDALVGVDQPAAGGATMCGSDSPEAQPIQSCAPSAPATGWRRRRRGGSARGR